MEGIKGLELISTTIQAIESKTITLFLVLPALMFILGVGLTYQAIRNKHSEERISNATGGILLSLMGLIIGGLFLFIHVKQTEDIKNDNIPKLHEFRIIDTEYHIDLKKYEVVEVTDDSIKLLELKK